MMYPDDYQRGALTGIESALSSLPSCPCQRGEPSATAVRDGGTGPRCGEPARPFHSREMVCAWGHHFYGTPREHEQARGALAAAERRAPHTQAERAGTRERVRAEVEAATAGKTTKEEA